MATLLDDKNRIDHETFFSWLESHHNIYLYGAGVVCKKFIRLVEWHGCLGNIKGILVTEKIPDDYALSNFDVKKFSEIDISFSGTILVTVSDLWRNEIVNEIKQNGTYNYAYLEDGFEKFLDKELQKIDKEIFFDKIKNLALQKNNEVDCDVLFLTPPYWDLYAPFSAVPCLVASLKKSGHIVRQCDLGIRVAQYCLATNWQLIRENCLSLNFYEREIKPYRNNHYKSYNDYFEDMSFLKKDYYDMVYIRNNYRNFNEVQRRVLDALYLFVYSQGRVDIDFDKISSLKDSLDGWYAKDFEDALTSVDISAQLRNLPNIIGISITAREQFLPACLLTQVCRMLRPDVKIIMGGSCADIFFNSSYHFKREIYEYFDYVIVGEGETAINKLIAYLKEGDKKEEDFYDIPNLMRINDNGQVSVSNQIMENVEDLPAPDYTGLDLSLYLSPEPILPYQASRGCHYGFCAFCNHDEKYRHNYRVKSAKKVVQDMLTLHHKYNVKNFQFVDEAIRPDHFRQIVEEMDKHEEFKTFKWLFYSRVSREYNVALLQKAKLNGCEMVMFGIETLNQRLLDFIRKGIKSEISKHNLKLFHENGIKTFAWLMCNLPSETLEEAKQDLDDIVAISNFIDAFSVGMFFLDKNTDMSKNPEQFNIVSINTENPFLFQSHFNGKVIDKTAMIHFFQTQYLAYQRQLFSCGNRYTLFFA